MKSSSGHVIVWATALLFATPAFGDTAADIKASCAKEWPTDYQLRLFCETQSNDAWQRLSRAMGKYKKKSEERNIIDRCWSEWYPQINMVEFCSNNQLVAYKQSSKAVRPKVRGSAGKSGSLGELRERAKSFCREKWTTNYRMIEFCFGQMRQAEGNLAQILKRFAEGGEEYRIIARCLEKWTPQLNMVEFCSKNQLESYSRIQ